MHHILIGQLTRGELHVNSVAQHSGSVKSSFSGNEIPKSKRSDKRRYQLYHAKCEYSEAS